MIRMAKEGDIPRISDLLAQVCLVHHEGRPDIFKAGRKYSEEELKALLQDESRPILVSTDEAGVVQGYCFCILRQYVGHGVMTDIRTLYIDDLCVDETLRGQHMGWALYEAAVRLAREKGCYNLTLNVWSCNPTAMAFYEKCGLAVQKVGMELIL